MKLQAMKILKIMLAALALTAAAVPADACSRVVYAGTKGMVLVGRTLDWRTPILPACPKRACPRRRV